MQQQERIQLSFNFSCSAACKSSSIVGCGFGCSFSFSDACMCSLATSTLSSGNSEQLSPRLTLRRQLGESYNGSLYLYSCSEGQLQRGLRMGSETRHIRPSPVSIALSSHDTACFSSDDQQRLSLSGSVQQQLQRQCVFTFSNSEVSAFQHQ